MLRRRTGGQHDTLRDVRMLAYAANRAKAHPHYLGWVLARYSTLENIAESDLAKILGTTSHDLARLSLCLRPRADCFAEDVEHISVTFNLDASSWLRSCVSWGQLTQWLSCVISDTCAHHPPIHVTTSSNCFVLPHAAASVKISGANASRHAANSVALSFCPVSTRLGAGQHRVARATLVRRCPAAPTRVPNGRYCSTHQVRNG